MLTAARMLRTARQEAGLTQRQLAQCTGVAQPTIARIEAGSADPRMGTLARLLGACGYTLASVPAPGHGVDRSQIQELLRLSPAERLRLLAQDVAGLQRLERARTR